MATVLVPAVLGLVGVLCAVALLRHRLAHRAWDTELSVAFARDEGTDPLGRMTLRAPRHRLEEGRPAQ